MHSERAQIVGSPNGIRLTTDGVFAGQQRAVENLDKSLERRENCRTREKRWQTIWADHSTQSLGRRGSVQAPHT